MKSNLRYFVIVFCILVSPLAAQSPNQNAQTAPNRAVWQRDHPATPSPSSPVSSTGLPNISLSRTQIVFGLHANGTNSKQQAVAIMNTGAGNLIIGMISVTDEFIEIDDCRGATIAPNASCTLNISFAPRTMGQHSGSLTISNNTATGPQSISLRGVALPPTFSSPSLTFDKQIINTPSPAQLIVVSNPAVAGAVVINISSVATAAPFAETDNCVGPLAIGGICTIQVTYTPTALCSTDFGAVSITDDQAGSPQQIPLSGSGGAAAGGIVTADLNSGITPLNLATALVGPGVSISNVTYTGAPQAAGTFTGGNGTLGFNQGIILSNGGISNVIGPNCSTGITRVNGTPGDSDLQALFPGLTTFDAAVLQFDFIPTNANLTLQYQFSSDEYNEFSNSAFNDVFAFFVNGKDAALIPGTTLAVAINTVNGGNPLGTNPQNPQFYTNNEFFFPAPSPFNTEMDGLTVVLTVQTPANPGVSNHIKLAIADGSDSILDSNVFIRSGSLSSPTLTFSPQTVAFGNVGVNTTVQSQVVLKNSAVTAVSINNIAASGAGFGQSNNCPASLGAGLTCTITVTFNPSTPGFVTGTVTVNDSAPDSPQSFTLSGTGVQATVVTITPGSVTFTQPQGVGSTSPSQPVVIKNVGAIPLVVNSVTPSGDFGETDNCVSSSPIAVNGSCTINVTFTPTQPGPRNGTITIVDNAIDSPEHITLSGTGASFTLVVGPGGSTSVTIHPGDTAVFPLSLTGSNGFSGTVTFTCTSPQTTIKCTITPNSVVLSGTGTNVFSISVNTFCSWNAPPGAPWELPPGSVWIIWILTLTALASFWILGRKNRRLAVALPLILLLLLPVASCSNPRAGPAGQTPPGQYNLVITGTSGGQSSTINLTLNVV